MKPTPFMLILLFVGSLSRTGAFAQTGVTVVGDVYIVPNGQVAIQSDTLILEADIQGEGEVIMAAKTPQYIKGNRHAINRMRIDNPTHVDVVSDLAVKVALTIPQGELHLMDAHLIIPNDGVISPHDRRKIRALGRGMLVVTSHRQTMAHAGASNNPFPELSSAIFSDQCNWLGVGCRPSLIVVSMTSISALHRAGKVPSPPPEELPIASVNQLNIWDINA